MKKTITIAIVILFAGILLGAEYVWSGRGAIVTATTIPQLVLVPGTNYCYSVSMDNAGDSEPVFWTKSAYTNETTATNGWVATTSMPLQASRQYTSVGASGNNEEKRRQIYGVVVATTNSTSTVYITFE